MLGKIIICKIMTQFLYFYIYNICIYMHMHTIVFKWHFLEALVNCFLIEIVFGSTMMSLFFTIKVFLMQTQMCFHG